MRGVLFVAVCAFLAWNPPHVAAPAVSPLLAAGLAVGAVAGFVVGRRVGHRDTAVGLPRLWWNRKLGRVA